MFTVVIPARFASSRLPGKPLAMIGDKPMIQHVYERAMQSEADKIIIATDDQRVIDAVKQFSGEVCLTDVNHVSGTDRIQQVASIYQLKENDIIVNVQGDEPLIPPSVINQVAKNLSENSNAAAATLSESIESIDDYQNPNIVKVVSDKSGKALYFSRSPIPYVRDQREQYFNESVITTSFAQRHIGIYAYRVSLLNQFVQWSVADLERLESLEQLRIIANGENIHVSESIEVVPGGVDTPEDLEKVKQHLKLL